jgi:hypothetical protein
LLDQIGAEFDALRSKRAPTAGDITRAVWEHYETHVEAGDRERQARPTAAEIDRAFDKAMAEARQSGAADAGPIAMVNAMADVEILANKAQWASKRRASRQKRLQHDLSTGDTRLIEQVADALLTRHGFLLSRADALCRDLCFKLMRADIEQLKRNAERDQGDFTGKPLNPVVVEPAREINSTASHHERIMKLFEKYEADNPNNIRPQTFAQARPDVQHFADFVGRFTRLAHSIGLFFGISADVAFRRSCVDTPELNRGCVVRRRAQLQLH